MNIEQTLVAYLVTVPALTALVSSRVYPLVLPQNAALPAIAYQRISGPREHSHSGPSGLAHPRIQLACWAATYAEAKAVAAALRQGIDGNRTFCQACFVESDIDDYEPETKLWRVIVDAVVWHSE